MTPETSYYVRFAAENEKDEKKPVVLTGSFATVTAAPQVGGSADASNVTATSAYLTSSFIPDGAETHYHFQYTTEPGNLASWVEVPGSAGTVPAAEATEEYVYVGAQLTGLHPGTVYYTRLFAENVHGEEGKVCIYTGGQEVCEPLSTSTLGIKGFETASPPAAVAFAVHSLRGEGALGVSGSVSANGTSTDEEQTVTVGGGATGGTFTLTFEGETTAPVPFVLKSGIELDGEGGQTEEVRIANALSALSTVGHSVENVEGEPRNIPNVEVVAGGVQGVYTVRFIRSLAGKDLPQMTADGSGLTPSGAVTVATVQSGVPFDASYHVEYTTTDFAHCGEPANPACLTTPQVDLGPGKAASRQVDGHDVSDYATEVVHAELSGLKAGETYHYRIVATDTAFGDPVVDSAEQALTVPTPVPSGAEEGCPNEAFRSGFSAHLPDCRAYEQVTPVDKRGTQDIFLYGTSAGNRDAAVGADGEHVMFTAPGVQWGSSPDPTHSTYVFSRSEEGWRMTSARPVSEPESITYFQLALWSPDLTQLAFDRVGWVAADGNESPDVELRVGPAGGPYTTVAKIPRSRLQEEQGFVAASADATKYIVQTEDRNLVPGHPTGTSEGSDLYEFTADTGLRQLNVGPGGSRISTCGAQMPSGSAGASKQAAKDLARDEGQNAVSADGSHVFFTDNCTHDLYMRVNGSETVDVGPYRFFDADAAGSKVLLKNAAGELFLYETGSRTVTALPGAQQQQAEVSADFSTIYFTSSESLTPEAPGDTEGGGELNYYRYDIAAKTLRFLFTTNGAEEIGGGSEVSPDGRYLYFPAGHVDGEREGADGVYRYDDATHVVQCISCASPFDPEPRLGSTFRAEGGREADSVLASANGDYVFFMSKAALVPQDIDGEANLVPEREQEEAEKQKRGVVAEEAIYYSASNDVYEWRKDGIGGCIHVQGCLALITAGRGGLKNVLLGTDASGRDVFFATHESLVPSDTDAAGDIYDARIGGGFPSAPPAPVECEASACSTPSSPPNDVTPASFTFSGAGNILQPLPAKPVVKSTKPKPQPKRKKRHKTRKQKSRTKTKSTSKAHKGGGR